MPNRTTIRGIPTGIVCAVLALLIGATPLGQALDDWFTDACFVLRGHRATTAKIAIISIDASSLDELQKPGVYLSPELAAAIRYAARQGATAIGMDYFIPGSLANLKAIDDPQPGDPDAEQGDGSQVARAADETQRVVLPAFFSAKESQLELILPLWQWGLAAKHPEHPTPYGLLNLSDDRDHFIRRQMLAYDPVLAGPAMPKFFAIALYARSRKAEAVRDGSAVRVADRIIPVDALGRLQINFVGPANTPEFPVVTLSEVLAADRSGRAMPQLADAIVIIGASGAGQQDIHATPYSNGAARLFSSAASPLTPGPEIHAHTIATIHDEAYLTRPYWLEPLPWALLAGAGLGAAFARVSLSRGAAVLAAFLIVLFASGFAAFRGPGWLLNPVPIAFAALATYAAVLARRWWQLRRMFAVVKSEAVARALEADPRRLDPGGELRDITALFADIRGFTTFSERCGQNPKQIVTLLNAYYTAVIPTIEAAGGTIIAFMGDGLMVLFGAPVSQPDHAARAVRAALAMARAAKDHAPLWEQLHFAGLRIGIGVHTGPAVVGAIGSGARKDYTAIGDTINTASRVEGETKNHAADVLITAATRSHLSSEPALLARCRAIPEPVTLKGRSEPVQLFQVTFDS